MLKINNNINQILKSVIQSSDTQLKWRQVCQKLKQQHGIQLSQSQAYKRWKRMEAKAQVSNKAGEVQYTRNLLIGIEEYGCDWQTIASKIRNKSIDQIKKFAYSVISKSITSLYRILQLKCSNLRIITQQESKNVSSFLLDPKTGSEESVKRLRQKLVKFVSFMYSDHQDSDKSSVIYHEDLKDTYDLLLIIKDYNKQSQAIQIQNEDLQKPFQQIKKMGNISTAKDNFKNTSKCKGQIGNQNKSEKEQNKSSISILSNNGEQIQCQKQQLVLQLQDQKSLKLLNNPNQSIDYEHFCQLYCRHNGDFTIICRILGKKESIWLHELEGGIKNGLRIFRGICKQRKIVFQIDQSVYSDLVKKISYERNSIIYELRVKILSLNLSPIISNSVLEQMKNLIYLSCSKFENIKETEKSENKTPSIKELIRGKLREVVDYDK